jgi:hypothetical protein
LIPDLEPGFRRRYRFKDLRHLNGNVHSQLPHLQFGEVPHGRMFLSKVVSALLAASYWLLARYRLKVSSQ